MAKKGEIENNILSKESAAFIYKTEKRQRNLWVSLVKRISRICTGKGCSHALPLQITRVPPCISLWPSNLSPH